MLPAFVPAMPPANTSAPALVDAVLVVTVTSAPSRRTFVTTAPLPSWAKSPPCATVVEPLRSTNRLEILYVLPWKSPV